MSDRPLNVRVAEALGWTEFHEKDESIWFGLLPHEEDEYVVWSAPTEYDTDWSATGPLIEKYRINLDFGADFIVGADQKDWAAFTSNHGASGPTPLIAVCQLILALKEANKLTP